MTDAGTIYHVTIEAEVLVTDPTRLPAASNTAIQLLQAVTRGLSEVRGDLGGFRLVSDDSLEIRVSHER